MDQETAIELLRERYAHGGVPLEEFRRVMGKLLVTTDPAECQALLDELPPASPEIAESPGADEGDRPHNVVHYAPGTGRGSSRPTTNANAHRIMAVFGSVNRSDALWDLGPETQATALFGEVTLDVRMARMVEGENILRVQAIFGEVRVTIPEGMDVTIHSSAQFGEVSTPRNIGGDSARRDLSRDVPAPLAGRRLVIYANATFGEVSLRTV